MERQIITGTLHRHRLHQPAGSWPQRGRRRYELLGVQRRNLLLYGGNRGVSA